jgi:phage terminase large subunit-like protein
MEGNMRFDESWMNWALQIEEDLDSDISAGLDIGEHLGEYLTELSESKNCLSKEKLMAVLQEELGNVLSEDDLESIVSDTQSLVRKRIHEKNQSSAIA